MPKLRVPVHPLAPGELLLDDAASRYVARVHRLSEGAEVVLFDPEAGTEADARLVESGRRVRCVVSAVRPGTSIPKNRLTLVQALGKGDKPEQVVRDATALSATRIVFTETARSVVRASDRALAKRRRWLAVAVEAARQSGRGDVPELDGPVSLEAALRRVEDAELRLCLSPGAETPLGAALREARPGASVALFVGPEGGFDDAELATLGASGVRTASLGELVLRTETAAVAALGAVLAARGGVAGD